MITPQEDFKLSTDEIGNLMPEKQYKKLQARARENLEALIGEDDVRYEVMDALGLLT